MQSKEKEKDKELYVSYISILNSNITPFLEKPLFLKKKGNKSLSIKIKLRQFWKTNIETSEFYYKNCLH